MATVTLASKLDVSRVVTKSTKQLKALYEACPHLKQYASVTGVLSVLSEPSVASWKQSIVLDSYGKQIMYTQKKQPNRVFSSSDLEFMRRVAESAPKQELQRSGSFGNEIHDMLTQVISGKPSPETPLLAGYRLWKKKFNVDIYYTDVFVYNDALLLLRQLNSRFRYTGFIDAVGLNAEGNLVVIDFKSGKGVYNAYALQLAAYCKALEVTCRCKEPIRNAYVLHFSQSNANFDYLKVKDVDACFASFAHCIEYKRMENAEEDGTTVRLFPQKQVPFREWQSEMTSIVDLIMYMGEQYPCLPIDLERDASAVYKSTRESQMLKRTLQQRKQLQEAIQSIKSADIPITHFVVEIGGSPLTTDLCANFCFSGGECKDSAPSAISSIKRILTTSPMFSRKLHTSRKKTWIYLKAKCAISNPAWVRDYKYHLPTAIPVYSFLIGKQDGDEGFWYRWKESLDGCPLMKVE